MSEDFFEHGLKTQIQVLKSMLLILNNDPMRELSISFIKKLKTILMHLVKTHRQVISTEEAEAEKKVE